MLKLYKKVILITILVLTICTIVACDSTQNNFQQMEFTNNWNSSLIMQKSQ
jgi:hypothetical protein